MKTYLLVFLLLSCLVLGVGSTAGAQEQVDKLALAGLLINDGMYARADSVLKSVTEDEKLDELPRYYSLLGLLSLGMKDWAKAVGDFKRSLEAGQTSQIVHLHIARAHFELGNWKRSLRRLENAGQEARTLPSYFHLLSQVHWKMGNQEETWQSLAEGQRRFPQLAQFKQQMIKHLIDIKLYHTAFSLTQSLVGKISGKELLFASRQFREAGYPEFSIKILEQGKIQDGEDENIQLELVATYLQLNQEFSASQLMRQLAYINAKYTAEAAELLTRSGRYFEAMALNQSVPDQKKKLKQRLSLLLGMEDYERAYSMKKPLSLSGLIGNEDIRYALAYSTFKVGKWDEAEKLLAKVTSPGLFPKAIELRKSILECEKEEWRCVL